FARLRADLQVLTRMGKRVFVILPNAVSSAFNPRTMLPGRLSGKADLSKTRPIDRDELVRSVKPIVESLTAAANASVPQTVDPLDYFCDRRWCPVVEGVETPVYRDDHHLRASFVRRKATFMDSI